MARPKKPAKDVKQVMAIRMKPGTKTALYKAADDDNRAPAQFVVKILEDWLKERSYIK